MATTYYEIPLTSNNQTFYITLAGVDYQMLLMWRDATEGGWFIDIMDSLNNPLIQGIPLVTGVDLLAQYPQYNFGGTLTVSTDGNPDAPPTYDNIGSQSHLYFGVTS